MKKSTVSLAAFAEASRSANVRCAICQMPQAKELNAARLVDEKHNVTQPKVSVSQMARWLMEECGYKSVNPAAIGAHFQRGHHRNGATASYSKAAR